MIHICIRHQYTVCPQPRIFFLVHRSYEQYCSNSYVCIPAVELRNGKRQAVTLLLSRRHPRGLSAPVERRGRASTPARPGSAHTFPSGHRARAGPSVTFPFPSAPVRPPPLAFPRPPSVSLSHADRTTRNQEPNCPERKENLSISRLFFLHKREGNNIPGAARAGTDRFAGSEPETPRRPLPPAPAGAEGGEGAVQGGRGLWEPRRRRSF